MPVPQHVLNWLYSILTSEYLDVNRTYNDVAQVLTRYPSLTPRTDVHTFPNGVSALLLHLSGTIPVNFRGNTYRFPMSIWVPHAYPREPPLVYVTPTDTIVVRPGQHVDPQGQVYHPYLMRWAEFWDKSAIHDFLTILSDVFAKEPPVMSRQQNRAPTSPQPVQSPPPIPPLPPEMAPRSSTSQEQPRPPPPPPKQTASDAPAHQVARQASDSGPAIPSVPSTSQSIARTPSRYDSAPPLPPQARTSSGLHSQPQNQFQNPNTPGHHPYPMNHSPNARGSFTQSQSEPQHQQPQSPPQNMAHSQWNQAWPQNQPPPPNWNQPVPQPMTVQTGPPRPPPDLLGDSSVQDVPTQPTVDAPPIPPNPEKDALLGQLAQTLAGLRQRSRQQNESSMAGLQAQRNAMLSVIPTMQSEMSQLVQLSNALASNTTSLHEALHKADGVIEGSRSHPAPDIDELLVAPTVVSNQLYNLVAEERALGDVIFMLGRAVERGRISPAVFAKTTRSLAREWYLKKALVRKIGLGMGLTS